MRRIATFPEAPRRPVLGRGLLGETEKKKKASYVWAGVAIGKAVAGWAMLVRLTAAGGAYYAARLTAAGARRVQWTGAGAYNAAIDSIVGELSIVVDIRAIVTVVRRGVWCLAPDAIVTVVRRGVWCLAPYELP